ncbi:energy transducer TonB [Ideonella sp. BN130291]|uniref:energy transducer TonB n=1 Tax=Ideonella sp. BN130291 TaxID=3112940 RepID=UPI002E2572E2|nr:energy transducer TonB [Ideonella sp. BN130291]
MAAHAQAPAPIPNPADPALAERAQREGDKVFKWILIHADKPRRSADAKPAAAAAAPATPAKAVARVKDEGIVERVTPVAPTAKAPAAASPSANAAPTAAAAPAAGGAATAAAAAPASTDTTLALAAPAAASATVALPVPEPEPEEDLPLMLVHQVEPEFPVSVLRRIQKGSVHVRFEVQPDGTVKQTEVLKTSSARLNQAAQEAVAQWRFMPLKHTQFGVVELAFNME